MLMLRIVGLLNLKKIGTVSHYDLYIRRRSVVLAARRLLKHVLYHLLYQLFKHISPATWVIKATFSISVAFS